jgi:ribokinase
MGVDQKKFGIVVVGSCVEDLVSYVPRFPGPGQAVMGHKFGFGFGGKGANQAVMAARLGARTAFVGKVGNDMFGEPTIENFRANGIDAEAVEVTDKAKTATANILVDDSGQNSIVVVLGANLLLSADDVRKWESKIAEAKVVVCQLEIKDEVTLETLKLAKKHGVTTIFNPAPGPPEGLADDDFFKCADIICPNENEAEFLSGKKLRSDADFDGALKVFLDRGVKTAIITLGGKGCVFATADDPKPIRVPAPKVKAVDTTGAGDSFVGSLAFFTAHYPSMPMQERIRRAGLIASISVQGHGTQSSYPQRDKIPQDLFD